MFKNAQDRSLMLSLESLEDRYMLAGDVSVDVSGGSLEIEGDDQDNIIFVTQINDNFAVIGIDTNIEDADFSTSIFGIDIDAKLVSGVDKNVEVALKGGDDVFLMNGSIDGVDLGDIFSSDISLGPAHVARNLDISTAGGRDFVGVLNTYVGRDLNINTGFGLEDVVVIGGGGAVTALLDYSSEIFDDVLGAGSFLSDLGFWSETSFDDIDFDPDLIGEVVGNVLGGVEIGRDLEIFGGSSHDYIYVGGVEIGRDSIIETALGNDNVYYGVGAYVDLYIDFFDHDDLVGGSGGGFYFFDLGNYGITGENYVGRNAIFVTSGGEDSVLIGGSDSYEFDLFLEEGFGGIFVEAVMDGGTHVGRELRINTGTHDDYVRIASNPINSGLIGLTSDDASSYYDVTVGRDLKLSTHEEDDIVEIGDGEIDFDDIPQLEGGPNNDFTFGGLLYVGRDTKIDTGTGQDELMMGEQYRFDSWVLNGTDGGFGGYQIHTGRDLEIKTGTHDDYVRIIATDNFSTNGTLHVGRDMDVNVDGGNDILLMGDGDIFFLEEAFEETQIYVGDDLDVKTGNQDDITEIRYTNVSDDTDIETSFGRDELSILFSYLGDKVDIHTGGERDTVEIRYSQLVGDTRIRTDIGDDHVATFETYFGGELDVTTSRGNDWVEILYTSVNDELTIDTHHGEDNVEIQSVNAQELEVDTGDDDDNVCAFDSMFDDGAEFDLGDGEDGISHNLGGAVVENAEGPGDC